MSFLLHYTDQRPDGAILEAINDVKREAGIFFKTQGFEGEWATGGFGIVAIRPAHVKAGASVNWGASHYWASSYAASLTWENWIDITQTDQAYEIVTGYMNLEVAPKTVEIAFKVAGKDLPSFNIEEMYAIADFSRVYFRSPLKIGPAKPWQMQHKGIDTGVEREGLIGYTVGTHAFLILRA